MKLRIPFLSNPVRVGVTIEENGLRFTEARLENDGVVIRQAGVIPLPEGCIVNGKIVHPDQAQEQLAQLKKNWPMRRKKAVLAVSSTQVVIRKTVQPKLSPEEIRSLLEIELGTTIHLPFSRPYFDAVKLGEVAASLEMDEAGEYDDPESREKQDEYLIIAAPGDEIDQCVELLKILDMEVTAIDIEPLALYRLLVASGAVHKTDFMFVQLGSDSVNISIFHSDIPEFVRNIPIHRADFHSAGASPNAMIESYVGELERELDRVINFYQFSMKNDGTRIKTIYVTGESADLQSVHRMLEARMSQVDIVLMPIHHIRHTFDRPLDLQAYTAAAGLTLRG